MPMTIAIVPALSGELNGCWSILSAFVICSGHRCRCYAKSPTLQGVFWSLPSLNSCTGVTGRFGTAISCTKRMHILHTHSEFYISLVPRLCISPTNGLRTWLHYAWFVCHDEKKQCATCSGSPMMINLYIYSIAANKIWALSETHLPEKIQALMLIMQSHPLRRMCFNQYQACFLHVAMPQWIIQTM